jgi:hypothetical protein
VFKFGLRMSHHVEERLSRPDPAVVKDNSFDEDLGPLTRSCSARQPTLHHSAYHNLRHSRSHWASLPLGWWTAQCISRFRARIRGPVTKPSSSSVMSTNLAFLSGSAARLTSCQFCASSADQHSNEFELL